jgi:ribonuclease D
VAEAPSFELITTQPALAELLARAEGCERYGLDTEFHRERTYFPQLALIQLRVNGVNYLIDPLAVDPSPLSALFESPSVAILHASRQDLEVLEHSIGSAPAHVFDTQIAAGLLGFPSASLASLLDREVGVQAAKGDRLTDWLRRPLTDRQLAYAAADVAWLDEMADSLSAQLDELGRLDWLREATEELHMEPRGPRAPEDAWRKIKEARHLKGRDLATAQAIAEWREKRAQALDLTPRYVLADLAVVGLAVAKPTVPAEFAGIRGIDARSLKPVSEELIAVIANAAATPRRDAPNPAGELPASMRPALSLITAWVAQLARQAKIDPALLANRSDLEDFLRGAPTARLGSGWRSELVGNDLKQLVGGSAVLAFDRGAGLVLEPRAIAD